MTASSSVKRKTLGLTFPSCGLGVMEPTSTKPNPIFNIPSTHSACLSNPAANPIGDSKSLPNTLVFYNINKTIKKPKTVKTTLIVYKLILWKKLFTLVLSRDTLCSFD